MSKVDMGTTCQKWRNPKSLHPNNPLKSQIRAQKGKIISL